LIEALLKDGPERVELNKLEPDALKRYIVARKERAKGKEIVVEDLRLEMRRGDQSLFTRAERLQHADLLEDANRTGDPPEKKALDAFETPALAKLKTLYETAPDPLSRFDVLGLDDVRAELGKNASKIFSQAERDRFSRTDRAHRCAEPPAGTLAADGALR